MKTLRRTATALAGGLLIAVSGCELPPVDTVQSGFRGVGMEHVQNPRTLEDSVRAVAQRVPQLASPPEEFGDPAPDGTWENVQVLGHLSESEFNRFKLAMTTWVAAETGEGCNYCHVIEDDGQVNFASDDKYQKRVSRDMISMTQTLNTEYAAHVGEAGVNCWTCHQGQVQPVNRWYFGDRPDPPAAGSMIERPQWERHYLDRNDVRIQSSEALSGDTDNRASLQQTEYTYWLMIQMSESLGVNCTYCHTSARWGDWDESPPQRVTAFRGLDMVRHMNMEYIVPLQDEWPSDRLGPEGDGAKVNCATCHAGAYIPQYGSTASHAVDWPALNQIGVAHGAGETTSAAMEDSDEDEESDSGEVSENP